MGVVRDAYTHQILDFTDAQGRSVTEVWGSPFDATPRLDASELDKALLMVRRWAAFDSAFAADAGGQQGGGRKRIKQRTAAAAAAGGPEQLYATEACKEFICSLNIGDTAEAAVANALRELKA